MTSIFGYASVVEVDGITRLYGPSSEPDLKYQNLQGNGLYLYEKREEAVNTCAQFPRMFQSDKWNIYPVWLNIRIPDPDSKEELELIALQKTLILIELPKGLSFQSCRFLGRRTRGCPDVVADKLSGLEMNGLRTFSSLDALTEAYYEFQRQIGSITLFASFWHQKA